MDLCPDPNLCKTLIKCYNERKTDDTELPGNVAAAAAAIADSNENNIAANTGNAENVINPKTGVPGTGGLDECLLCSEQKRDTLFKPCGHVCCCETCAPRVKKCLICRESVSAKEKVCFFTFSFFQIFK